MNILKHKHIPRRTFLRGCGAALSLPFLEVMQGRGAKISAPKRVAFFYTPNGVAQEAWHPKSVGDNFSLSPTLKPLEPVRKNISFDLRCLNSFSLIKFGILS